MYPGGVVFAEGYDVYFFLCVGKKGDVGFYCCARADIEPIAAFPQSFHRVETEMAYCGEGTLAGDTLLGNPVFCNGKEPLSIF